MIREAWKQHQLCRGRASPPFPSGPATAWGVLLTVPGRGRQGCRGRREPPVWG